MEDQIWLRAQGITNCGLMKSNTVQELDIEYEIKNLVKKNKEAVETKYILRKQLFDLYQDRKSYIEAIDELFDCANNSVSENTAFWSEVLKILGEENDQFKLDSVKQKRK